MSPGTYLDVCAISGIPNVENGVYDDGYRPAEQKTDPAPKDPELTGLTGELKLSDGSIYKVTLEKQ